MTTNSSHLQSFVGVSSESHFPIQNLPFGICRPVFGKDKRPRVCSRIGDYAVDLLALQESGYFSGTSFGGTDVFERSSLNDFIALGRQAWQETRNILSELLRIDRPAWHDEPELRDTILIPVELVEMQMPLHITRQTAFFSANQGRNMEMIYGKPEYDTEPLWNCIPVGNRCKTDSIVKSGSKIKWSPPKSVTEVNSKPSLIQDGHVDFGAEMGYVVSTGNASSEPLSVHETEEHVFGLLLVLKWLNPDMQNWEYRPFGPCLSQPRILALSPWIVTTEALKPYKTSGPDQVKLPSYLKTSGKNSFDIRLHVSLKSEQMRSPYTISSTNFTHLYWNICQQLAYRTRSGYEIRADELFTTGHLSSPVSNSSCSFLELTQNGTKSLRLPNGEKRRYLQDGDWLQLTGYCQSEDRRLGFGEVNGTLVSA